MLTPQKKGWVGWSLSPPNLRSGAAGSASMFSKGKGVADGPQPPPPVGTLGENGMDRVGAGEESDVWRHFREAGLLDEESLRRKDREALAARVAELEKELQEYQYNMGLLLIEKKEWATKYEEIKLAILEKDEILKREQVAHLTAISEFEKREESLRKALGVEKQCVTDLERALHEMRSEIAEVKFTAEKKLAEAHALEASLEEKSLDIEARLHSADAKFAEASRKSTQANRLLEEIEARERRFEKEKLSFENERRTREKNLKEQDEYLQDWDIKLKESQNRLLDLQRSLNDREERANEYDKVVKKQLEELEGDKKRIESMRASLKKTEDDILIRQQALSTNEKDFEAKRIYLEKRECELAYREEQLNARETVGLQKLLDDHRAELESKKRDFDLELDEKRKSFDKEMKQKLVDLEMRETDYNKREEQIAKREEALDSEKQKLKYLENDIETKSKALKKWEESVKNDEKLSSEQRQLVEREKEQVENVKLEIQSMKAAIEAEKEKIMAEEENLKITEDERQRYVKQTAQLKQEIEEYRMRTNSLLEESEDLRQQRQKFEKEWEVLDEKRVHLEAEGKKIDDERERFERWRDSEEKRMKSIELEAEARWKKESEDIALQKEAFRNEMQHQRIEIEELLKRERADNNRNLQLHKHELEMEMEKKLGNKERELQERENELNRKIDFADNKVKYAIDLNESKIQKIMLEKEQQQREREALLEERRKLEANQAEMKKDTDSLIVLSQSLKDRREQINQDRSRLISVSEKCRVCKNCGVSVFEELDLLDLQDTGEIQNPCLVVEERYKSQDMEISPQGTMVTFNTGSRMSLLQKCSKLFRFSPGKKSEQPSERHAEKSISFGERLDQEAAQVEVDYEPTPIYGEETEFSFGVADNSADILGIQSSSVQDIVGVPSPDQNGRDQSVASLDVSSQPEPSKQGLRRSNKRSTGLKGVRRNRTIKAAVEDAKAILGETSQGNNDGPLNGESKDHPDIQEEDSHGNLVAVSAGQKRHFSHLSGVSSEQDAEDSEARSESVSVGGQRRKRRQTSGPVTQTPGEKRYNFRRRTTNTVNAASAAQTTTDKSRAPKGASRQKVPVSGDEGEGTSREDEIVVESMKASDLMQKSTVGSEVDVHAFSQKIVEVEVAGTVAPWESTNEEEEEEDEIVNNEGAAGQDVGPSTPSNTGLSAKQDEEDEEEFERQNLSIGKKLWDFFTT